MDFEYPFAGARMLVHGQDPYVVLDKVNPEAHAPFDLPLYYPLPALLVIAPLTPLSPHAAGAVFFGISAALLAWFVTRRELWRLHLFASAPFVIAATVGQFAPLMMLVALVPGAGALAAFKPNIGAALLAYRPSRAAVASCIVVGAVSLAVLPRWPLEWWHILHYDLTATHYHLSPWRTPLGFLLLLAVVAWRREEGRLFLAMILVPQMLVFYDQLPLWLVPKTRGQSILLTATSQLAVVLWFALGRTGDSIVLSAAPWVMALIYFPALLILLGNEAIADKARALLPAWARRGTDQAPGEIEEGGRS